MDNRLRVGLLLDSPLMSAWAFTAVERVIRSNHAEVALVILNRSHRQSPTALKAFRQDFNHWFYRLFTIIDEKIFVRGSNASAQIDPSGIFSDVPILEVELVEECGKRSIAASDRERIKVYHLDVLVNFGSGTLRGKELASLAQYGIWTYRWGDRHQIEDGLTGFWEVVRGWPETGASLQQLGTGEVQEKTLFESWFFSYPYSPARSRNYILWAASSFLPRQIERLHRLGGDDFGQDLKMDRFDEIHEPLKSNRVPSNLMVLLILVKLAARNLLEVWRRIFYREQWELLFNFGHNAEKDISAFKKLSPPKDRFWADPHVIYQEPNYYVFVEEYPYRTKRGHISVIEMDRIGNYKEPIPVLKKDCHLSFPFVFDWLGHYYMIPESSGRRTIDLYECIKFPDQWQLKITLMKDIKAVDTTLFYIQGKWWLFTAMAEQEAAAPQVELFLFYAEDLFTDHWHAHLMNPIVSDVKRARGAGRIFLRDGKLFRPSQDCSKAYGYGFDVNEIVTLSETEYSERTVMSVRPDRFRKFIATHTYANQGNLTVIDALTRRPK